jgi:hypothetical protein
MGEGELNFNSEEKTATWSIDEKISKEILKVEGKLVISGPMSGAITATVSLKIKDMTFTQSSIESVYVGSGVGSKDACFGELVSILWS